MILALATALTPAQWGLPAHPLRQIAFAGLTPVTGTLLRHDHVHLDVIVNGRRVVVPAGVRETVAIETPALRATSRMVAMEIPGARFLLRASGPSGIII